MIKTENDFQIALRDFLAGPGFPGYLVEVGENLLYALTVDPNGNLIPELANQGYGVLGAKPRLHAFQTDILIRTTKAPRVVLELKWGTGPCDEGDAGGRGFSTHDVLTYSAKARRHKEVYPYLRYGFVVGNAFHLGQKFFAHGSAFDFGAAIRYGDGCLELEDLVALRQIVVQQLEVSEALGRLQCGHDSARRFSYGLSPVETASRQGA